MDWPVTKNANENPAGNRSASAMLKEFADATIRVRYAETDQMGVVYYGNYFTWFEIGRVELCRQLGFEYRRMEAEDDSFLVVAEARCRYKRPTARARPSRCPKNIANICRWRVTTPEHRARQMHAPVRSAG